MVVNVCTTRNPPLQLFSPSPAPFKGVPTGSSVHSAETVSPGISEILYCEQTDMTTGLAEAN